MREALDIRIRGIVQGVGYRPFIYNLAFEYQVSGWVLNDKDGVLVHAEAESALLDDFVMAIADRSPVAAKVAQIELAEVPLQDSQGFEIRESGQGDTDNPTQISADLGICVDCAAELLDPENRRFRYPFINCTNCGPRFTIIRALPYDRVNTSMAEFHMCDLCQNEYEDPKDRRFHAQPDACFTCGPELALLTQDADGTIHEKRAHDRETSDDLLEEVVGMLIDGGIVAVKGLGGFHLVCDAYNAQAIATLRERKHRDGKPFAVMMLSPGDIRRTCYVSEAEEQQLTSPARPIVLLAKRDEAAIAPGLADDLKELGVMLPATPLQILLMHDFKERTGKDMLVMTSGNLSSEPIIIDDEVATERLLGIADAILGNNRQILSRFDDSVLRVLDFGEQEAVQFIRRARGYAPVPLAVGYGVMPEPEGEKVFDATESSLPDEAFDGESETQNGSCKEPQGDKASDPVHERSHTTVFAAGSEQKNTFAYVQEGDAYVSQYIGDVEDADVFDAWLEAKERFQELYGLQAHVLACDLHPEYLTSKWARSQAFKSGLPLTEIQHHQAHIASVLGEHSLFGPCCGIAFDGTGYGPDGAIWGGEVLIENQIDYERFANLIYMPLPGGSAAIEHPLRMAYGMLWAYDLLDHPAALTLLEELGEEAGICESMIERGINTPYTSSMGRFFDGIAALLGVCTQPSYEGEAAILLDACRALEDIVNNEDAASVEARYRFAIQKNAATAQSTAHDTSVVLLDGESTLRAILDDIQEDVPVSVISLRFHDAVIAAIVQLAELVRSLYDINLVALSGGCFMNRYLSEQSVRRLNESGFTVALNASLPPNDGCISYGQGVVASVSR